ncbi:hypothetical protein F383_05120 [Gossypium arboreum]|uniref:Uncharacterized protein n=1 Tax=Gossypium arboreum TaxID=29729 RepID=A0A0B0PJ46_GOSAR|nr:hypothetical protein F383_05120 [Gossypium arboreum]
MKPKLGLLESVSSHEYGRSGLGSWIGAVHVWISSAYRRKQVIPNHTGLRAVRDSEWPHVLQCNKAA